MILAGTAPGSVPSATASESTSGAAEGHTYSPVIDKSKLSPFEKVSHRREKAALRNYTPGMIKAAGGPEAFLMISEDFGNNFTWNTSFPASATMLRPHSHTSSCTNAPHT